jgi:hypothetical protein
MQEMTKEQHQQIIDELKGLNDKLGRQNSWRHVFAASLVYGVGFVIGSTILASILASMFLPILQKAPYMREFLSHPAPVQQAQSSTSTQ